MHWAFSHRPDDEPVKAAVRATLRVLFIMTHEFSNTNISLRASALTFSIILSMVPMLAMSTAILKGLGSGDQLKIVAFRFIDQLDPQWDVSTITETGLDSAAAADNDAITVIDNDNGVERSLTLNRHLHNAIDTIFNYVENTNFAALGAFGIAGLLIVVIMVLSVVEDAMNAIWHTERGRSLFRKIMDFLALLILLPVSINVALAGDAILESPVIMGYISTVIPSPWVVQMLLKLLPFTFITMSLMMMYLFFPHVRVKTYAAFWGAVFGSIFWFIVQRAYVLLQIGVAKYNAIYGSFATVPLFLVWLQLGWTFILLGAVLAYAIQNHNQYKLPGTPAKAQQELQRAFDVLLCVYNNFALGRLASREELSKSCPGVAQADLDLTVKLLTRGKLLHRVQENGVRGFMPSQPVKKLTASCVVRLVLGYDQKSKTVGGDLAEQVIQAGEKIIVPADFPEKYLNSELQANAANLP
jgi:membrane protein